MLSLIESNIVFSIVDKIGTPERPLSDLGRESYLSWWTQRIIEYIRERKDEEVTLANITKSTGIKESDILWTLE
jgi:histone acetyltransferase HTATIP/histone acetyltransferase MYST1